MFSEAFSGLFRATSQTFAEDSPGFCGGLSNPSGSSQAWPDGRVATYVQDEDALPGFCGAFVGDLPSFAVRVHRFYRTLASGTLHCQNKMRVVAPEVWGGFAGVLQDFYRTFLEDLRRFWGEVTGLDGPNPSDCNRCF